MKTKTLKESQMLVRFYETARIVYQQYKDQFFKDYVIEMERRCVDNQMDFEEYVLTCLYIMFNEPKKKRKEDVLFRAECGDLIIFYRNNHKKLKRSWDKSCDDNLFEWVLTSYDRYKADMKGTLSLSTLKSN